MPRSGAPPPVVHPFLDGERRCRGSRVAGRLGGVGARFESSEGKVTGFGRRWRLTDIPLHCTAPPPTKKDNT